MNQPKSDKPEAARLGWQVLETDYPFENAWLRLRRDRVITPAEKQHAFTYVDKLPVVFVLPLTPEGEMVLIRQFRYIVDAWLWQIPAGGSHDFDGTLAELARKELWEEAGGKAENVFPLGHFFGASGVMNQTLHAYLATGVELDGEDHTEETEMIEVHVLPVDEALRGFREELSDAFDGYVVLRYEPLLRAIAERVAAGEPFEGYIKEHT